MDLPPPRRVRKWIAEVCDRRMADTSAHLVDRVFPEVPLRQWLLSLPIALRFRLAYNAPLVRDVLQIFVRVAFRRWQGPAVPDFHVPQRYETMHRLIAGRQS